MSTVLDVVLPSTTVGLSNNYQSLITGVSNYITNTVIPSTMSNILTYPNIYSTIKYDGASGFVSTPTVTALVNSGTAYFSSFQYDFTYFTSYINPNGSSRLFLEFSPSFTFSQVMVPSSISTASLFPVGSSNIVNLLSMSSHLIYVSTNDNGIYPVLGSGIQQYIPVTSVQPYGYTPPYGNLSNTFYQPMRMEISSGLLLSPSLASTRFSIQHYLSSSIGYVTTSGSPPSTNVTRSGLQTSTAQINNSIGDNNSVFIKIYNSGNKF
jgi:hypothetical protein